MKRCPTCHRSFPEEHLTFCTEDGTPLTTVEPSADELPGDETTQVRPPSTGDQNSSVGSSDRSSPNRGAAGGADYQPPGSYVPPGYAGQSKSRTWPWVVGVLAIVGLAIAGVGIAAAMLVRNMRQSANVPRQSVTPVIVNRGNSNSNSNTNSESTNGNSNSNSEVDDTTPPPTDSDKVLADLKQLEDEWTVANINADKKKLNHILADDYVGINEGRVQGKAQYLKAIEPDDAIQHWEFENLKLTLNGDRASLTGVLQLDVKDESGQDQHLTFRFTDKFVWRDGRWQATASEVAPVPVKPGTAV